MGVLALLQGPIKALQLSPKEEAERHEKAVTRAAQEEAWDTLFSLEVWYRRHYNLPSTDPRFLSVTHAEMRADFWSHVFLERYHKAQKDGREIKGVDDLLLEDSFDEQLEALDRQLEQEARERSISTPDPTNVIEIPSVEKEESIINWHAPRPEDA